MRLRSTAARSAATKSYCADPWPQGTCGRSKGSADYDRSKAASWGMHGQPMLGILAAHRHTALGPSPVRSMHSIARGAQLT